MEFEQSTSTIAVSVTMRLPSEGGRSNPVSLSGTYRPHLRIRGDEKYLGVAFVGANDDFILPGVLTSVAIRPLYDIDYRGLIPGVEFDVLEGNRVVGIGVVD